MYRTPEIVDLYSNFPIGEKQDIWVSRLRPRALRSPATAGAGPLSSFLSSSPRGLSSSSPVALVLLLVARR